MKITLSRTATAASFVFAAPLLAVSALANDGVQESTEQAASAPVEAPAAPAEQPAPAATPAPAPAPAAPPAEPAPAAAAEPAEEERICRSIRLDMSSRRKTRVCLTEQGWLDLNNQR